MNYFLTGGASGLGKAIAEKIVDDPANKLYFTYCYSETEAGIFTAAFKNSFSVKCDFSNNHEIDNLLHQLQELDIDILINNAYSGTFIYKHFNKIPVNEFQNEYALNILPTVRITQSVIELFRKKKSGKIITILTAALLSDQPIGSAIYLANKAYLGSLLKCWAIENRKFNISSNGFSPPFMPTNFTKNIDERMVDIINQNEIGNKRYSTIEVAEAIYQLACLPISVNGINFDMDTIRHLMKHGI